MYLSPSCSQKQKVEKSHLFDKIASSMYVIIELENLKSW